MNDVDILSVLSSLAFDWSWSPARIRKVLISSGHIGISEKRIKKLKSDRNKLEHNSQFESEFQTDHVEKQEDTNKAVSGGIKRKREEESVIDVKHPKVESQVGLPINNGDDNGFDSSAITKNFSSRTTSTTREFLTCDRFDSLSISSTLKRALSEVMGYEHMTKVQSYTIGDILAGRDVLAKAKTGTGKTLGFLIPTVERVMLARSAQSVVQSSRCYSLVISPTRELAQQIAEEASALTRFVQDPPFNLVTVYGGKNMNKDVRELGLSKSGNTSISVDILVATPGRLIDHLENTGGFEAAVKFVSVLILDEADQLLDMGFRKDIEKIVHFLPKDRQTLLFSATVPPSIKDVANKCLRQGYSTVDCVGEEKQVVHQVGQELVVISDFKNELPTLFELIAKAIKENPSDYKLLIFFITARQTGFVSEVARLYFKREDSPQDQLNIFEIHSRKGQGFRNRESESFRNSARGILFSSDVSARGLDYPGITHVIQVGAPTSREQYIHRLGRTARAGEAGRGIMVLQSFETYFLQVITDLELKEQKIDILIVDSSAVSAAVRATEVKARDQCYQAWLGYHNGLLRKLNWSKQELVDRANCYADTVLELDERPRVARKVLGKMGLMYVEGLLIG